MAIAQAGYDALYKVLSQARTVFITAHVGPDGDTLGSMLALKHALPSLFQGIERIDCVISGKLPDIYTFMPGVAHIKRIEQQANELLAVYDVAISVDCGSLGRLGEAGAVFKQATMSVNIDHHVSNDGFAQLNIIEPDAAASGEVIANILKTWGYSLSTETAVCLYVALLTDTGGFRHSCTTPSVFRLAADLQEAGVDVTQVYRTVFEEQPLAQVHLQAYAVTQASTNASGRLVWVSVTQALLKRFNAQEEHIEGLIDKLRAIQGVQVAAVLRETEEGTSKVSLRSNTNLVNVSAFLESHYNGGGHTKAAGASSVLPVSTLEPQLVAGLQQLLVSTGVDTDVVTAGVAVV
jgi:bifunctional oligoribonuclease and PAP phosphatase NrnA